MSDADPTDRWTHDIANSATSWDDCPDVSRSLGDHATVGPPSYRHPMASGSRT